MRVFTSSWLGFIVVFVSQTNGATTVVCTETGQYCAVPKTDTIEFGCFDEMFCTACAPCPRNAHIVKDCTKQDTADTRVCECNNGYTKDLTFTYLICKQCTSPVLSCPANSMQVHLCDTSCTCNTGYTKSESTRQCEEIPFYFNVSCNSTGQYCERPYSSSTSSGCYTRQECKTCRACSRNAHYKTTCQWTTFTDTQTCECDLGYEGDAYNSTCTLCPECPPNSIRNYPCGQCYCPNGYHSIPIKNVCQLCIQLPDLAIYLGSCLTYTCPVSYFPATLVGITVSQICMKSVTCSGDSQLTYNGTPSQYCACNPGSYSQPYTKRILTYDQTTSAVTYVLQENQCVKCTICGSNTIQYGICDPDRNMDVSCICQPGYYGPYIDPPTIQNNCTPCPPRTFSNVSGETMCQSCPLGTRSSPTTCVECVYGTYTNISWDTCTECYPGFYAPESTMTHCFMCTPGTYSVGVGCISCGMGRYSGNASTTCSDCKPGSYSDIPEAWMCKECDPNFYSNITGASSCLECVHGTFSPINSTACEVCQPGSFASHGFSECKLCDMGTYQPDIGALSCLECLGNFTFSNVHGSTVCFDCSSCVLEQGFYYHHRCNLTVNSECRKCTECPIGTFMTSQCTEDADRVCSICPSCPNGSFFSGGCINGLERICKPCSSCAGDVRIECTPEYDTVCSLSADCRVTMTQFRKFTWMTDGSVSASAFEGCTKGQYIADLNPLVCGECPPHLYGPNGLWCEPCKGYTEPYVDQTSCVCISPSVIKSGDVCECDVGFFVDHQGCQSCKAGTFKNFSVVLEDNWWDQDVPCLPCPYGSWSFGQASSCFSCLPGQYRANESLLGCESCESGFYALDATRSDSCVACNSSCEPGFFQAPCPLYDLPDRFLCVECGPLPTNANWTVDCYYDCSTGFFKFNDTCVPCSLQECPIGFTKQACTLYADINCDVPCTNETKPLFSSVWDKDCSWACEKGYVATALDYGMWTQYECIEESTKPFWLW